MSEIQANSIGNYSGNNIAMDNALNFKSYTTTQRNALSSVAGDVIFNSTDNKLQVYADGSWNDLGGIDAVSVEYLLVGGGGGGGSGFNTENFRPGGGGGGGGVLTNVSGQLSGGGNTASPALYLVKSVAYRLQIGAGGVKGNGAYATTPSSEQGGGAGSFTNFAGIFAFGGGGGNGRNGRGGLDDFSSGPKGGSQGGIHVGGTLGAIDDGRQGYAGGKGTNSNYDSGGGGGAGAVGNGTNGASPGGNGHGGIGGTTNIITTTEASSASVGVVDSGYVYFAGGGGSGGNSGDSSVPDGGLGGGGRGSSTNADNGADGTVNTGGGGGGGASRSDGNGWDGSAGGSGFAILRYASANTATFSAGITQSTITQGSNKVSIITAGTGTVTFT